MKHVYPREARLRIGMPRSLASSLDSYRRLWKGRGASPPPGHQVTSVAVVRGGLPM